MKRMFITYVYTIFLFEELQLNLIKKNYFLIPKLNLIF